MAARKSAATKATQEILEAARLTDLRRQKQIDNQTGIINRLLEGGGSYDTVLQRLNDQLAETQVMLSEAEAEISRLRAEQGEA